MQVVIVAAGKAKRMTLLSEFIPKPLLPHGSGTLLENLLKVFSNISDNITLVSTKSICAQMRNQCSSQVVMAPDIDGDYFQHLLHMESELSDVFVLCASDTIVPYEVAARLIEVQSQYNSIVSLVIDRPNKFPLKIQIDDGRITNIGPRIDLYNHSAPLLFSCRKDFLDMISRNREGNWTIFQRINDKHEISFIENGSVCECNTPRQYLEMSQSTLGNYVCSESTLFQTIFSNSFAYNSSLRNSVIENSIVIDSQISNEEVHYCIIYNNTVRLKL